MPLIVDSVDEIPNPFHVKDFGVPQTISSKSFPKIPLHKKFWKWKYLGLYAHYAGLGLIMSSVNCSTNFCYYYFRGPHNVCANSWSLIVIPWGFKIFLAILTDSFRPWGYRRKIYLSVGWAGVVFFTLLISCLADSLSVDAWIGLSLLTQLFLMLADTVADGICIEVGQLEPPAERGQVLATGQRIRFILTIFGAIVQSFLLNGKDGNPPDCRISPSECWSWGLSTRGYYGLLTSLSAVLAAPILWYQELDASAVPQLPLGAQCARLLSTLRHPTTLYLIIFVAGNNCFSTMNSILMWYVQYELLYLTNLQSGLSSVLSCAITALAIYLFQSFLRHANWRRAQVVNVWFCAVTGLLWIPSFYNYGHTLSSWFAVFLNLNMSVGAAFTQVVFGMAVIELAEPGLEATSYELIISVANCSTIINNFLATQLLTIMNIETCIDRSHMHCQRNPRAVNLASVETFFGSNGPNQFMIYSVVMFAINIVSCAMFTRFLPKSREQCRVWKYASQGGCEDGETIVSYMEGLPKAVRGLSSVVTSRYSHSHSHSQSDLFERLSESIRSSFSQRSNRQSLSLSISSSARSIELRPSTLSSRLTYNKSDTSDTNISSSSLQTLPAFHSTKEIRGQDHEHEKEEEHEYDKSKVGGDKFYHYFSPKEILGVLVQDRNRVGFISISIAALIIGYQTCSAVALLDPKISCKTAFGGPGCHH